MSLVLNEYTGDGVTTTFNFSMVGGYLSREFVVFLTRPNDKLLEYSPYTGTVTWLSDFSVRVSVPIPIGTTFVITRRTSAYALVDFQNTSRITERNLDTAFGQSLHRTAELDDVTARRAEASSLLAEEAVEAAQDAAESAATSAMYAATATSLVAAANAAAGASSASAQEAADRAEAATDTADSALALIQQAVKGNVDSFNGRDGAVLPERGDYTPDMVGFESSGVLTPVADFRPVPAWSDHVLNAQAQALADRTEILHDNQKRTPLNFATLAEAADAAATLPDGQYIEAPDTNGRASQYSVQSGALVFVDYAPDTIRLTSYAALRAYSGGAETCNIIADAISGVFMNRGTTPGATDNGGTRIIDAVGRLWERKFSGAVMIPWFTQGTANDTVALQAAFAAGKAIRDGGGGYTYNIDGTIELQDGQNMLFSGAEFKQLGVQKPLFDAKGKKRIRCRYGRFTGLLETIYLNSASSQSIGFAIEGADDVSVSDCEFENFVYSPIMSNAGANNVTFKDNKIKGPGGSYLNDVNFRNTTGFTLGGTNIVISGNLITATTQGGIITQGTTSVSVTNNIIHDLVNENGLYFDTGVSGVSVTGNIIRNTGINGTGIKVQLYDSFGKSADSVSITGNTIYASGATAILVINTIPTLPRLTSGVTVVGNTIYSAGQDGISLRYVRAAAVSGNSIYTAANNGIEFLFSSGVSVTGNTTMNTGRCGIFDAACGDMTYVGNTLISAGVAGAGGENQAGLFVSSANEHFIANNVVRGTNMTYCMYIAGGGDTLTIIDNALSGGTLSTLRLPGGQIRFYKPGPMVGPLGIDVVYAMPETLQRGEVPGEHYGTAVPTTGTWKQGQRVHHLYPAAGGVMGWVCVVGGTPGTWRSFGSVAA